MSTVAIDLEVLVTEVQAVCVEISGMKWENEFCKIQDQYPKYGESDFYAKAEELRALAERIRALKARLP